MLSAVCNKFPNLVGKHINDIAPYIIFGLESGNAAIIRNSAGVLSDLCTLTEDTKSIMEGFEIYMPILLNHLKSGETDRMAKITIITVIGDTFLATKENYTKFLEDTLSLFEGAAEMSIECKEDIIDDLEELEFKCDLQSSLIESYTCFMQTISETSDSMYQTLGQFIEPMFHFLLDCCSPTFAPDDVSIHIIVKFGLIFILYSKKSKK